MFLDDFLLVKVNICQYFQQLEEDFQFDHLQEYLKILNQNEPISYSPVFNIFIKNDNGSNENINGDIDFLILKCPNGYEIDLNFQIDLYLQQTENY